MHSTVAHRKLSCRAPTRKRVPAVIFPARPDNREGGRRSVRLPVRLRPAAAEPSQATGDRVGTDVLGRNKDTISMLEVVAQRAVAGR